MKSIVRILIPVLVLLSACGKPDPDLGPLSASYESDHICKGGLLKTGDPVPEQSCIRYSYDGDSLLKLTHLNAGFNCCPEGFALDVQAVGDSLIVREEDLQHGCKCNCLYDLDITIHNLPPGAYRIKIEESKQMPEWPALEFDVDLKAKPEGEFCVTRPEGWWR